MTYFINPKSLTLGQLYGEFDRNTREWSDGILSAVMRHCARAPAGTEDYLSAGNVSHMAMTPSGASYHSMNFMEEDSAEVNHWIVLDGPVDPIWIENLNTVRDLGDVEEL